MDNWKPCCPLVGVTLHRRRLTIPTPCKTGHQCESSRPNTGSYLEQMGCIGVLRCSIAPSRPSG